MKHLELFEAYSLSLAKQLTKPWKDSPAERRYDRLFGKGEYRIYIPVTEPEIKQPITSSTMLKVEVILKDNRYRVVDYIKGTASKDGDTKNIFKIGKLLQHFNPEMKLEYDSDMVRDGANAKPEDLLICISRHPYDIGGSSTGRGWKSCMNLEGELTQKSFIKQDIKLGSLVAYLIYKKDRNLKRPLGRILIKPHLATRGVDTKSSLYPERKIYGTNYPGFRSSVVAWCHTVKPIGDSDEFTFYRVHDKLYNDSSSYSQNSVSPITSHNLEIENYLGNDIVSVRHSEGTLLGLYNRKTKKLLVKPDFDKFFALQQSLFVGVKSAYSVLFDMEGNRIGNDNFYHINNEAVKDSDSIYFSAIREGETETSLYRYEMVNRKYTFLYAADQISFKELQSGNFIILYAESGQISVYDTGAKKISVTPLVTHMSVDIIKSSTYGYKPDKLAKSSTLATDGKNYFNLTTGKLEPLLQGYEHTSPSDGLMTMYKPGSDIVYSLRTNRVIGNPIRDTYTTVAWIASGRVITAYKHVGLSGHGAITVYDENGKVLIKGTKSRSEWDKENPREKDLLVYSKGIWYRVLTNGAVEYSGDAS